ncbi:glycosyltransferase family 4 protein [Congregibacter litoralis]|uniref:Glycosyltransferase n=1 Tax=Congregibacter litoralis KT71 TaxID=314285 RepID=A4A8Y0_9GAMM|nr:glycosyltransferase family 4 protein [Congregibacter litoralis]EAQ97522.1 Glycosyltransferase [Congregibacter litoralis KT71]
MSGPLHIALLGYRSQPHGGGQGIYLHYLSKALVEAGHKVDVISGPPYPELDPRVRLIHIPSLDLFTHGLGSLRPRHLLSLSDMIEWCSKLTGGFAEPYTFGRRVRKYLHREGRHYDLIHDNQSLSYGVMKLQHEGFSVVTTVHHPITHDLRIALRAARSWYERLLVRRWHSFLTMQGKVIRQLRHVITVSEQSRQDIATDFGLPVDSIDLVYNGIDTAVFRPHSEIRRRENLLMATASADAPLKGLRYLLKAYASLLPRYPDLELLVVGRPQPGGKTEQLLDRLALRDRVRFISGISTGEMVRHYAEATVAVIPSIYEGFGLPAGEAMACAVPVVSTDGGALPEIVADAGVIVPSANAEALAGAIGALLEDPSERERLARAGRERILNTFSWTVCGEQMVRYYREVIADADR